MSQGQGASPKIELDADELGPLARLRVDASVFSETAVLKTAYWLTDTLYVFLSRPQQGELVVELREKTPSTAGGALTDACGQFANALLDHEVRQRVLAETSVVRDTLVRKAFFEARKAAPATILSDESRVSKPGETAKEDPVGARRSS